MFEVCGAFYMINITAVVPLIYKKTYLPFEDFYNISLFLLIKHLLYMHHYSKLELRGSIISSIHNPQKYNSNSNKNKRKYSKKKCIQAFRKILPGDIFGYFMFTSLVTPGRGDVSGTCFGPGCIHGA